MSKEQTKAQALAWAIENPTFLTEDGESQTRADAAAELRRLQAENEGLRAQVEALSKDLADAKDSAAWHKRRTSLLQSLQSTMQEPERAIVCDVLANGHLLQSPDGNPDQQRYAAPALTRPAVPPGYALVPIEPTEAMDDAVEKAEHLHRIEDKKRGGRDPELSFYGAYRAALAAAPQPEAPQTEPHVNSVSLKELNEINGLHGAQGNSDFLTDFNEINGLDEAQKGGV